MNWIWFYFGIGLGTALYGTALGWRKLNDEAARKHPMVHGLILLLTIIFVSILWPVLLFASFVEGRDA